MRWKNQPASISPAALPKPAENRMGPARLQWCARSDSSSRRRPSMPRFWFLKSSASGAADARTPARSARSASIQGYDSKAWRRRKWRLHLRRCCPSGRRLPISGSRTRRGGRSLRKKGVHFQLFYNKKISRLDKNPAPGNIFTRRPTFPVGENTRKYTMSTSDAFRGGLVQ